MKYAGVVVITLAVLFIGGEYFFFSHRSIENGPIQQANEPQTYTSDALGVQFQYISQPSDGGQVSVKEVGDKIYVYTGSTTPESGQFVQVFSKQADESFAASIRRQLLADYPSPKCKVEVSPSNIQSGYQVAEITYPRVTEGDAPWFADAPLCNQAYDQTNGMRYFLFDPKHPDKFAFLDIGQYAILGHDQIPWQYTLTFTK